ncbi:MAG: hypothetical protein HFG82_11645 [Dorea sp.]|nr:hypothetical protein [Dorea sp.]
MRSSTGYRNKECQNKTRVKIRDDSVLINFPL